MNTNIKSSIKTLSWDHFLNRGLLYGDGLFETMRAVGGRIPLWDFHWQRLEKSAQKLSMELPEQDDLFAELAQWQELKTESVVKLVVFKQSKGRGYLAKHQSTDWVLQSSAFEAKNKQALDLALASTQLGAQPQLAGMKHLSRMEQVLLAQELAVSTADELLVCDQSGYVIEAVSQNVVFVKNNAFYTPDLTACGVDGVGLAWFKSLHDVTQVQVKPDDLTLYDAMFLINSVRGVTFVNSLKGIKKFSINIPLQDRINRLWNELMIA